MQLSAVCAAATVSARPARQTEEGCSLRLTLLTPGQHNATNKATHSNVHYVLLGLWVGEIFLKYHVIMFSCFKNSI